MKALMRDCPSRDQLAELLDETLPDEQRDALEAHLDECAGCRQVLESLLGSEHEQARFRRLLSTYQRHRAAVADALLDGEPAAPGYEILDELGRGGMGVVYKARERDSDRLVALKVLDGAVLAGPARLARFRTESQALARLNHPHIVQQHDMGQWRGRPFVSLELIDGESLASRLKKGPLPARQAARLVEILARAIHEAHRQGVVHRDLKPANILLSRADDGPAQGEKSEACWNDNEVPKIVDFGLAKQLDENEELTRTGEVMGSPSYMAPEQASSLQGTVGPATDVYALGVILYELLTGRPPFQADNALDTLLQVTTDDPVPPSRLQSKTPRPLETISMKCLQKQPLRRYASAADLADDLARWLDNRPIRARPPFFWERLGRWSRRNPAVALLLAALVVVVVAAFVTISWQLLRVEGERQLAELASRNANNAALRERSARLAAQAALRDVQRSVYMDRYGRAYKEWLAGDVQRMLQTLEDCPAEFRHFEWHYLQRLAHQETRTLHGHRGAVNDVVFSGDAATLVSCGQDGTVRVWDWTADQPPATIARHQYGANCVALIPGTGQLASGGADGTVIVSELKSGQTVFTLRGHQRAVFDVAVSSDGQRLASASEDGTVRVWDPSSGEQIRALIGHHDFVSGVAFEPGAERLVSVGHDGVLRRWDAATGEALGAHEIMSRDGSKLYSVAFSPDGKLVGLSGTTISPLLMDAQNANVSGMLTGHSEWVGTMAFSPDGTRVATASDDLTVRLWDRGTHAPLRIFRGHTAPVSSVAFSSDGTQLASAGLDGTVKIWDANQSSPELQSRPAHAAPVRSLARHGTRLVTGSEDATLKLWDTSDSRQLGVFSGHTAKVVCAALSPDGRSLLSGGQDNTVRLWDVASQECRAVLRGHGKQVTSVAFHPDGRRFATGSGDLTVRLWDARSKTTIRVMSGHEETVRGLAISPDGRWIASGGYVLRVWDVETGRALHVLDGQDQRIFAVAFSPDNDSIATAAGDGSVKLWDAREGQLIHSMRGPAGRIVPRTFGVAFSGDGLRLASCHMDGHVRIWDPVTGREVLALETKDEPLWSVTFSDEDRRILAACYDGAVKIWDARSVAWDGPR